MTEMQSEAIRTQWRNAALTLGAVVLFILFVFFDTVKILVMTWWDKPEYNHCLLILPILIYLLYERREIFHKIAPKPSWLGLLPILAGGGLWLLGDLADANVVRQFGLVILLQGSILTILGWRVVLALMFPIFYMVFLIPFGDFLVPALQDFTTAFVVTTLNILSIPVYVEGVFLSIPAGDFHVAEACAGLRFLVATVALGTLMANVAYKTIGRQIIVVLLSFIVPVIANGLRASGIVLVAHWSDMKYATGVDHIVFGWIFFAVVLLIFISIAMTFTNRGLHDGYIDFSKEYWQSNEAVPLKKFIPFLVIGLIAAGGAPAYVSVIDQRLLSNEDRYIVVDEAVWGHDAADKTDWKPFYDGASQTFHLKKGAVSRNAVDVFVAYYKYQAKDAEMIRFGNGVAMEDIWERADGQRVTTEISGSERPVKEVLLHSRVGQRLVWYWYWVDGEILTSNYKAKLYDARAKLLGGRLDSAVVALSVPVDKDVMDQQRQRLAELAASLPSFETMVRGEER